MSGGTRISTPRTPPRPLGSQSLASLVNVGGYPHRHPPTPPAPRTASAAQHQPVAGAAYGLEELRRAGVGLEISSQPDHEVVDRPRLRVGAEVPHLLQDLALADDLARVLDEELQQHRLEQGEAERLAPHPHLEGAEVDLRIADARGGEGIRIAARPVPPAKQPAHAREQHGEAE